MMSFLTAIRTEDSAMSTPSSTMREIGTRACCVASVTLSFYGLGNRDFGPENGPFVGFGPLLR